jgi:hypothetical protein
MTANIPHTIPPSVQIANAEVGVDFHDDKAAIDQVEGSAPATVQELTDRLSTIPRSAYASLSPSAAIRKFKRQFLMGALASVGAL